MKFTGSKDRVSWKSKRFSSVSGMMRSYFSGSSLSITNFAAGGSESRSLVLSLRESRQNRARAAMAKDAGRKFRPQRGVEDVLWQPADSPQIKPSCTGFPTDWNCHNENTEATVHLVRPAIRWACCIQDIATRRSLRSFQSFVELRQWSTGGNSADLDHHRAEIPSACRRPGTRRVNHNRRRGAYAV